MGKEKITLEIAYIFKPFAKGSAKGVYRKKYFASALISPVTEIRCYDLTCINQVMAYEDEMKRQAVTGIPSARTKNRYRFQNLLHTMFMHTNN